MQNLQRLDEGFQGIDASHAETLEKSRHQNVGAGEGRRMGHHHFPTEL